MLHSFHGESLSGITDATLNYFYKYLSIALQIDATSLTEPLLHNPPSTEKRPIESRWIAQLKGFNCSFQDIPLFERTERVCWEAVRLNAKDFCYVPDALKSTDLCLVAMEKEPSMILFLPEHLQSRELWKKAVGLDAQLVHRTPDRFLKKDVWLAAATQNGLILSDCPENTITSDLLNVAVRSNGAAITCAPLHLLTSRLCEAAITSSPHGAQIKDIPPQFQTEKIRLMAVVNNPMMLAQIPAHEQTEGIRLAAVKSDGNAIQFIPAVEQTKLVCFHALLNTLDCHPWVSKEYLHQGVLLQQQLKPDSRFPKTPPEAVRKLVQGKCAISSLLAKSYLSQFSANEVVSQISESVQNAQALSSIFSARELVGLFRKMKIRGVLFEQDLNL
jgi:hypothetical protein